jgi:hypothetical protein
MLTGLLCNSKRRNILFAPQEARYRGDDIFLKRSVRTELGDHGLMKFFKLSQALARKKRSR